MTNSPKALFVLAGTFKITNRGLVLFGYIAEGVISNGDTIEFTAFDTLRKRKIISVEGLTFSQPNIINTGLRIECEDETEIEELLSWEPGAAAVGVIY